MTTADNLRKARDIIDTAGAHAKGSFAKSKLGVFYYFFNSPEVLNSRNVEDFYFCVTGAIGAALNCSCTAEWDSTTPEIAYLIAARGLSGEYDCYDLNDKYTTQQVIDWLTDAIFLAEQKGE